jgi:hypothetical protein
MCKDGHLVWTKDWTRLQLERGRKNKPKKEERWVGIAIVETLP